MRDISLHILDLARNSLEAGADFIGIEILKNTKKKELKVNISDNGAGIENTENAFNPFYTTNGNKKLGLGLALFKGSAEKTGGKAFIVSKKNEGTLVSGVYNTDSIDCIGLGEAADSIALLIVTNPKIRFKVTLKKDDEEFILDTDDILKRLNEIPMEIYREISDYLNTAKLFRGCLGDE